MFKMTNMLKSQTPHLGFVVLTDQGFIQNEIWKMIKLFTTWTLTVTLSRKVISLFIVFQEKRQQRTTAMKSLFESKGTKNWKTEFYSINRD